MHYLCQLSSQILKKNSCTQQRCSKGSQKLTDKFDISYQYEKYTNKSVDLNINTDYYERYV